MSNQSGASSSRLLRLLYSAQVIVEAIEAGFQVPTVLGDPRGHVAQPFRLEPAWPPLRLPSLLDEPGPLEHLEVLRDRREAQVERRRQLRNRGFSIGESRQNRSPGGIGQGRERRAERICWRVYFSYRLINLSA